jgi:hypothetical protein
MTKKPTSKGWERAQRIHAELQERVAEVTSAVLALPRARQLDVLLAVLDAARAESKQPGLYEAAETAAFALIGGGEGYLPVFDDGREDAENRRNREHNAMVERLAEVGRGGRLQVTNQTIVNEIRELGSWLDAARDGGLDAETLSRSLAKRFERPVEVAAVRRGLDARRHNGRVTWVALAAGVIPGVDAAAALREPSGDDFTRALNAVREALKIKDLPGHAARPRQVEDKFRKTPGTRQRRVSTDQLAPVNPGRNSKSGASAVPPKAHESRATGALQWPSKDDKVRHKGTRAAHKRARRT